MFLRKCALGMLLVMCAAAAEYVTAEEAGKEIFSKEAEEAIALLDSKDAYERQKGFLLLESLREEAVVPTLLHYANGKDAEKRAWSLRAIAGIQGARGVPLLLDFLAKDKNAEVRRSILLGLEPLQRLSPEILPALIRALRDKNTVVRMTAVDIVSRIDDPRIREVILDRAKRERRRDVKRVLEVAVERVGKK